MKFPNRVHEAGIKCGFSREQLALAVEVSRQTIGLIETGRVSPSTKVAIRLGRVLGQSVESLFGDDEPEKSLIRYYGPDIAANRAVRVATATILGVPVARALNAPRQPFRVERADALVDNCSPVGNMVYTRPLEAKNNPRQSLFISGCDLALGLLADHVSAHNAYQGLWFPTTNQEALNQVLNGVSHVAAVHLKGEPEEWSNNILPMPYQCVMLSKSQVGWVLKHKNPMGFERADDLSPGRFRLVNRPKGSGARMLLDNMLKAYQVRANAIQGYELELAGHLEVADAIANGFADVGIAQESAAVAFGLHFIPIQTEASALVIPNDAVNDNPVKVMLDRLASSRFQKELWALGPYDVSETGKLI